MRGLESEVQGQTWSSRPLLILIGTAYFSQPVVLGAYSELNKRNPPFWGHFAITDLHKLVSWN